MSSSSLFSSKSTNFIPLALLSNLLLLYSSSLCSSTSERKETLSFLSSPGNNPSLCNFIPVSDIFICDNFISLKERFLFINTSSVSMAFILNNSIKESFISKSESGIYRKFSIISFRDFSLYFSSYLWLNNSNIIHSIVIDFLDVK